LWYWSAVSSGSLPRQREGTTSERNGGDALEEPDPWERAIACWAMLASTEAFWLERLKIAPDLRGPVQTALVARLKNDLDEAARQIAPGADSAVHLRLQLALTTELECGKTMAAAGLKVKGRPVACGRLMLTHLGLADLLHQQLEARLAQRDRSPALGALRDALSPRASIRALLDQKRHRAALEAVDALPAAARKSPESVRLRARALLEVGLEQASLEQFDDALESWRRALECQGLGKTLTEEIRNRVVTSCLGRANQLGVQQRDEAMAALDRALGVVSDDRLKLALANLLEQRGVETVNAAHASLQRDPHVPRQPLYEAFEGGIADLGRAVSLGSARAAQQGAAAKSLYEQWTCGVMDLSNEVQTLRGRAAEAANRKDWNTAVGCGRDAIEAVDGDGPELLYRELAVWLSNRAVADIDAAVLSLNRDAEDQQRHWNSLWMSRPGACAKCGQQQLSDAYGNLIDLWYNFTLPTGITVLVCSGCKVLLERRAPDALTVERLRSAETDLHEASALDPSNAQIQKNLHDLLAMFGNIGLVPFRPRKSRSKGTRKRPGALVKQDASGVVGDVPMFGTAETSAMERRGPAAWMLGAAVLVGLAVVGSQLDDYFYEDPSAWRSQLATSEATGAPSQPSSALPEGEMASVVDVEPFAVRMPAGAQIREGPGSEFPVVAENGATARYQVFQETPNWRRIRLAGDKTAWVLKTDTRVLRETTR
jgi:tetratricopeptide (TPR) repeat protein